MTKNDTIKLIAVIVMAYPSYDKFKDEKHIEALASMWASLFKDDDAGLVSMAVRKHISNSKWPPSIAEIREIMTDIQRPDLLPPDAAWSMVTDALSSQGEYFHGDLFKLFPPLIARVVKTIGWHNFFDMRRYGNREGMDRMAFMELYKPAYERARKDAMLPPALDEAIKRVSPGKIAVGAALIAAKEKEEL